MFSKPVPKLPEPTLPRLSSTVAQRESLDTGRVKSKRESAEYRAFQKCFADLVGASGILIPSWLAEQLFSKELIGSGLLREAQKPAIAEQVKIGMLLSAVEGQLMTSPTTIFQVFLGILQSEPSLHHLSTKLEITHRELCTPIASPSTPTPSSQHLTACTHPSPPLPTSSLQHLPSNSCPPLPPAKRPKIDSALQCQYPLEHTMQPPDIHHHQTCPQECTIQSATLYDSGGQSSAVGTYASYLKLVYTREKLPIYDKWPQVKSKKYINLALIEKEDITKPEADRFTRSTIRGNVDDIKKSKRAMNIDQIAKLPDESWPKCILVEGAPGVGKSTFAWKLCHEWGKGKLLQQYKLVVLLRLRDKSVRAAKNISDLFQYHDNQIQQASVEEIKKTGGKGVLFLFEGYDELPGDLRTENSIFLNVITGWGLPEATVLITSRPWASEFLHIKCKSRISQHVEILGFTKDDIQSYLESTTAKDPSSLLEGLKKYISCYPHIGSLMYIPLYSAFVVEVYRNSRKDETTVVPKTMTELYSSLVRDLLRCYLLDHPVYGIRRRWKVRSFSDLSQDAPDVYQQLCELGRIAYEGILHEQQIFSDLPEDFETLGLMQCVPELHAGEEAAVSYNFLHLTVQEYLAAFHLSLQPVEKQVEQFRRYCSGAKQANTHLEMVLRFLSGITKLTGYPSELVNTLEEKRDIGYFDYWQTESEISEMYYIEQCSDLGVDSANVVHEVTFSALHWLFEAHDTDVIARLLGSSDIQLNTDREKAYAVTPFDCYVLGYCVSHSNCTWFINLQSCKIGAEGVELLVQGTTEEKTHCTGRISKIDLFSNKITSEGVMSLLSFPNHLIEKLEVLDLAENKFQCISSLVHLVCRVPHLKELAFDAFSLETSTVPLITALIARNSLECLHMPGIGVEDCQALHELLSSSTSLKWLTVYESNLLPEAIELIISGLHNNSALTRLQMDGNCFSLQNTISLASVLRTNHTLLYLSLRECHIGSKGATKLASALYTNSKLQILDLENNPIRVKGATTFAEMLLKNTSLKGLNLRGAKIGEEGAKKLNESLTYNTTVRIWFPELLVMDSTEKSDSTEESDSEKTDSTEELDSTDQPHL